MCRATSAFFFFFKRSVRVWGSSGMVAYSVRFFAPQSSSLTCGLLLVFINSWRMR